jgi:serine/alanine adding enzyme
MQSFNTDLEITHCTQNLDAIWDDYVRKHPNATHCHLSGWRNILGKTYRHNDHYLLARGGAEVLGVLPMFYIRGLTGKGSLISMPFLDTGGVLAQSPEIEEHLLSNAISLAKSLTVNTLELRHTDLPQWAHRINQAERVGPGSFYDKTHDFYYFIRQIRVRMLIALPSDPDNLMSSFKSKLRSQIKKSMKEGCELTVGGRELVDQFYEVFAVNMRDLGSPVHSKQLFAKIFEFFPEEARIFLVKKDNEPIAGSLTIGFRDTLANPWASSLRKYSHMSPNMLLYWKMLEYACQRGFAYFDFGRSSPNEGTFKFKEQWGAAPHSLNWIYASSGNSVHLNTGYERSRYERAIACWKKLPVPLTKLIGPKLRKHITL